MEILKEILDLAEERCDKMNRFEWEGIKGYLLDLRPELDQVYSVRCTEDDDSDNPCACHELCGFKAKIINIYKIAIYYGDLDFIIQFKKFL